MAQEKTKAEEYLNLGGINTKASKYATGPHEFLDLSNIDFREPGALTKRDGTTLYLGATVTGKITGLYQFDRLNGDSSIIATANTNAYTVTSSFNQFKGSLTSGALFEFQTFVDRLFATNGAEYFKYDGTNSYNVGLPPIAYAGVSIGEGGGLTGVIVIGVGAFNDRGFYGPVSDGHTVTLNGITFGRVDYYGLSAPTGFGISGFAFYRSSPSGIDMFRFDTADTTATYADTGVTALTATPDPGLLYIQASFIPKYLSIYNNQLMTSGFSGALSTVWFSEIGEPEAFLPESSFEVRTNDGDQIMGQVPYNGAFLIFKEKSVHRLTGTNPDSFVLSEVSDQYGCISHRAIVVWQDVVWWLDSNKGIVEYNGANIRVVSTKVEPVFSRINVSAARFNATAVHDRARNQLKFAFPVDGATENNFILTYDYVADAWSSEAGYEPSVMVIAQGSRTTPTVFMGGYTGTIATFGASIFSDLGQAMTVLIKSRFLSEANSITKEFRRLYLDTVVVGPSAPIAVNLMQDYGASIVVSRTMYQAPFQSRIDFGVQGKALACQFVQVSATDPLQINGYTVEYRLQRRT